MGLTWSVKKYINLIYMKLSLILVKECMKYILGKQYKIFTPQMVKKGMLVELEHGYVNPITNITNDDPVMTCKIALAHLFEDPNYYNKLSKLNL